MEETRSQQINLTGKWRFPTGTPIFEVVRAENNPSKFTFKRTDGEPTSFHGHGVIEGNRIIISWRSTLPLGHGSDESQQITFDTITKLPIEIRWKGDTPYWLTISN